MINEFIYKDSAVETRAEVVGNGFAVTIGDSLYRVMEIAPGKYSIEIDGKSKIVCCVINENKSYLDIDGLLLELMIPSEDNAAGGGTGAGLAEKDKIYAPMPGKVVKLLVKEGDEIRKKQPMVIVEAMKMEHQVNALADGTVKKINFADGDQVDTDTPIIELEIADQK